MDKSLNTIDNNNWNFYIQGISFIWIRLHPSAELSEKSKLKRRQTFRGVRRISFPSEENWVRKRAEIWYGRSGMIP